MAFSWKSYSWAERDGGTGAPGIGQWSAANVDAPDASGHIAMRLTNPTGSQPIGCEFNTQVGGYGTYTCVIEGNWSTMGKDVVFGGMFTYGGGTPGQNEMDVDEVSAWGANVAPFMKHTLWYSATQNYAGAAFVPQNGISTHRLIWTEGSAIFRSWNGTDTTVAPAVETTFTTAGGYTIPVPAGESLIFNLWASNYSGNGYAVSPFSCKIRDFTFVAAGTTSAGSLGTLQDSFATKNTTKWTWGTTATQSTANGGQASLPANAYGTNASIISAAAYDLTNSGAYVDLAAIPSTVTADGPFFEFTVSTGVGINSGDRYRFLVYKGAATTTLTPQFYATDNLTGTPTAAGTVATYSPTSHRYLRIRHDGVNVVWESSADATTWASLWSRAPGAVAITSVKLSLLGAANAANTGAFVLNNVNGETAPVTGNPKVGSLVDHFDVKDTALWDFYGSADATGVLSLPATAYGTIPHGVVSKAVYDLTGSNITFDLDQFPVGNGESYLYIELSPTAPPTTNALQLFIYQTGAAAPEVEPRLLQAGTTTTVYGIARQRYLRIAHVPGTTNVRWRTSPDGTTWTTVRTYPIADLGFAIDALRVTVRTGGTATGTYGLNSINGHVRGAISAPSAPQSFTATAGQQSATLSWTAPVSNGGADLTAYELTRTGSATVTTLPATQLSYTYTGLTAGQLHTFTVRARNSADLVSPDATVTATPTYPPATGVPGAPTAVAATAGNASAVVSWTAPATTNGTITGYDVIDQTGAVRAQVIGTAVSTTVSGLTNGTAYTFRVVAKNANGSSLPSAPSNTVTPQAGAALYQRSAFGAYPGANSVTARDALEAGVGQALQPVVMYLKLGGIFPTARVTNAASRGRRVLLMLGTAGMSTASLAAGGYDTQLDALGDAIAGTGAAVFVAPMYEVNDYRKPWSPSYGLNSPGYVETESSATESALSYRLAFDRVARRLRSRAALARLVWSVSVDPQPVATENEWAKYYPGAVADVLMLQGFNHGDGPGQGTAPMTTWRTPAAVFDAAYTTAAALHATKPIWFYTASHDAAEPYTPVGPGFEAGSVVPANTGQSKATWVTDLLNSASWARVTSVVYHSDDDTRRWSLTSSQAAVDAARATVDSTWARTEIGHDFLGDYIRDSTEKFAAWATSGQFPATRTNEYARPDGRPGVRAALVFGVPYSPGEKTAVNIPVADMLNWNRAHGLLLRQAARHGMQSWAHPSGALAANDPVYLLSGTVVNGRTVLNDANDDTPGAQMQFEGGMKAADGGTVQDPLPAPAATVLTALQGEYNDPTTEIGLDWTALTATQLVGYTLTGYRFGWTGGGTSWVSALFTPETAPDPFVFSNLTPGTTYQVYVEAVATTGTARTTLSATTTQAVFNQPPSAPATTSVTNPTSTTMTINWTPPTNIGSSAITGYTVAWGGWESALTTPETRSMNLTNFVGGQTYTISVYAWNAAGRSPAKNRTWTAPTDTGGGTPNPALLGMAPRFAGAYLADWAYGTIPLANFSQNWNFLLVFSARPTGNGSFAWQSATPTGISTVRGRGQRVILSFGGAGATFDFLTRTHSQNFVNSVRAINTQWGGTLTSPAFDGVDFNTFEADAVRNSAEYIWMGHELKRIFGFNFIVTAPPTPNWGGRDHQFCRDVLAAGAFDFVSPQYYDGGLATSYNILDAPETSITWWVNNIAGGDASKIGVGFGITWPGAGASDYMTWQAIHSVWNTLESRHPSLRAAWIWRSDFDANYNGGNFAATVSPDVLTLGPS